MVKESVHHTGSHHKSELDKFRIFYEFVAPSDKRPAEKASRRSIMRNSQANK